VVHGLGHLRICNPSDGDVVVEANILASLKQCLAGRMLSKKQKDGAREHHGWDVNV
jgi:hypothetical protein